jgi:N-acetylmuramoyl-L-alanine amidase
VTTGGDAKSDEAPPEPTSPTLLAPIRLDRETPNELALTLTLPTPPTGAAQARRPEPTVLEITLPGVAVNLPEGFKLETPSITEITRRFDGQGTVYRFVFARPMAAEIVTEGSVVRILIVKPTVGDGRLAGKVIVIDPGHGGHDSGAAAGGVREKDLNLQIGTRIASKLTQAGATVIMTRKTDVFIALAERARIANSNDADLFISVHINSNAGTPSTGTMTFHHKSREVGKLLAECLHREIMKVAGLPDKGVVSDGRIYQNGFAVLRLTKMPGVLLELGFINNQRDRQRMVTTDFQEKVSEAVVRGIQVFLGDAKKE